MHYIHWPTLILKALLLFGAWYLAVRQLEPVLLFLFPRRVRNRSLENESMDDPGFGDIGFEVLGVREERLGPWKRRFLVLHHPQGIYCDVPESGFPYMISDGSPMVITRTAGRPSFSMDGYVSTRVNWPVEPSGELFRKAALDMLDAHTRAMEQGTVNKQGTMEHRLDLSKRWYASWARHELWMHSLAGAIFLVVTVVFTFVVMAS